MSNISITAIIPCFNREKTIVRCIDSVLKQLGNNDKIIVVDDASKDNSVNVIKKAYIDEEKLIVITNENNLGVSATRNKAIELLTTDLVTFIDSDDYISDGYIDHVKEEFLEGKTDMFVSGFTYVDEAVDLKNDLIPNSVEGTLKDKIFSLDEQGLLASSCNKVYKVDIIKQNKIRFNTKVRIMEDFEFNINYLQFIKDIKVCEKSWYNYVYHGTDSASSKYQKDLYLRYKEVVNLRQAFYNDYKEKEVFKLNTKFLLTCLNNLYKENDMSSKERRCKLKEIMCSSDFLRWKKETLKSGVFEKIIYYATLLNNSFLSDSILNLMHRVKNSSKVVNKVFRKLNKKA